MIESEEHGGQENFSAQVEEALDQAARVVLKVSGNQADAHWLRTWKNSGKIVADFKPVPWFIWRVANYVFGKPGDFPDIQEGLVLGLRRLLFAAASDAVMGRGEKINNVRKALQALSPDVVAAVGVVHAICRRLASRPFERIWRPVLDDAVVAARIGFLAGTHSPDFGAGRGMLAGFSTRSGLAVLLASGNIEQATDALEKLAEGGTPHEVGLSIYDCDPLQVSSILLSAAGCGPDAGSGVAIAAFAGAAAPPGDEIQPQWIATLRVVESLRLEEGVGLDERYWQILGFKEAREREWLTDEARKCVRRGHGWNWII